MTTLTEWVAHQANVDLDAQKTAQLKSRLAHLGFSNAQVESAAVAVKASGAYDAIDIKPSSIGAFLQSVKEIVAAKPTTQTAVIQSRETELIAQL